VTPIHGDKHVTDLTCRRPSHTKKKRYKVEEKVKYQDGNEEKMRMKPAVTGKDKYIQ